MSMPRGLQTLTLHPPENVLKVLCGFMVQLSGEASHAVGGKALGRESRSPNFQHCSHQAV